ncbi:MAG: bifunctional 4-hydroxy-2-oxoglutarate aldolase/2-dehydro-3-deoxy-phosphogluconate aldolase [Planctomycetales bacterium]|nr:bifunctional 4-hydroxy-2-oxoglutarate aldolase/2-dehydro-3-deoxy-phosphogluconate aldolase [Planctomycetales bacterium]
MAFLEQLERNRASAILRTNDTAKARHAMDAAVRAGFQIIEFTLSIPQAVDLIHEYRQRNLLVGAGTVLTVQQADEVMDAGACFVVSPVVDLAVIQRCVERNIPCMPGCSTPTEMLLAYEHGATLQKLFPESPAGPTWVKQTLGPLPFLRIVPTSGVTLANAAAYLQAGAFAVGFVNSLFDPADIAADNYDAIYDRAVAMLDAVRPFSTNID